MHRHIKNFGRELAILLVVVMVMSSGGLQVVYAAAKKTDVEAVWDRMMKNNNNAITVPYKVGGYETTTLKNAAISVVNGLDNYTDSKTKLAVSSIGTVTYGKAKGIRVGSSTGADSRVSTTTIASATLTVAAPVGTQLLAEALAYIAEGNTTVLGTAFANGTVTIEYKHGGYPTDTGTTLAAIVKKTIGKAFNHGADNATASNPYGYDTSTTIKSGIFRAQNLSTVNVSTVDATKTSAATIMFKVKLSAPETKTAATRTCTSTVIAVRMAATTTHYIEEAKSHTGIKPLINSIELPFATNYDTTMAYTAIEKKFNTVLKHSPNTAFNINTGQIENLQSVLATDVAYTETGDTWTVDFKYKGKGTDTITIQNVEMADPIGKTAVDIATKLSIFTKTGPIEYTYTSTALSPAEIIGKVKAMVEKAIENYKTPGALFKTGLGIITVSVTNSNSTIHNIKLLKNAYSTTLSKSVTMADPSNTRRLENAVKQLTDDPLGLTYRVGGYTNTSVLKSAFESQLENALAPHGATITASSIATIGYGKAEGVRLKDKNGSATSIATVYITVAAPDGDQLLAEAKKYMEETNTSVLTDALKNGTVTMPYLTTGYSIAGFATGGTGTLGAAVRDKIIGLLNSTSQFAPYPGYDTLATVNIYRAQNLTNVTVSSITMPNTTSSAIEFKVKLSAPKHGTTGTDTHTNVSLAVKLTPTNKNYLDKAKEAVNNYHSGVITLPFATNYNTSTASNKVKSSIQINVFNATPATAFDIKTGKISSLHDVTATTINKAGSTWTAVLYYGGSTTNIGIDVKMADPIGKTAVDAATIQSILKAAIIEYDYTTVSKNPATIAQDVKNKVSAAINTNIKFGSVFTKNLNVTVFVTHSTINTYRIRLLKDSYSTTLSRQVTMTKANATQLLAAAAKDIVGGAVVATFPGHPGYTNTTAKQNARKAAIEALLRTEGYTSTETVTVVRVFLNPSGNYDITLRKNGVTNTDARNLQMPVAEGTDPDVVAFVKQAILAASSTLVVPKDTPGTSNATDSTARALAGQKAAIELRNQAALRGEVKLAGVNISVAYDTTASKFKLTLKSGTEQTVMDVTLEGGTSDRELLDKAVAAITAKGTITIPFPEYPGYTNTNSKANPLKTEIEKLLFDLSTTTLALSTVDVNVITNAAGSFDVVLNKGIAFDYTLKGIVPGVKDGTDAQLSAFIEAIIARNQTVEVPWGTPSVAESTTERAAAGKAAIGTVFKEAAEKGGLPGGIDGLKLKTYDVVFDSSGHFKLEYQVGNASKQSIIITLKDGGDDKVRLAGAVSVINAAITASTLKINFPPYPGYTTANEPLKITNGQNAIRDLLVSKGIQNVNVVITPAANKYNVKLTIGSTTNTDIKNIDLPVKDGTPTELLNFAESVIKAKSYIEVPLATPRDITDPARATAGSEAAKALLAKAATDGRITLPGVTAVVTNPTGSQFVLTLSVTGSTATPKTIPVDLVNAGTDQDLVEAAAAAIRAKSPVEIAFKPYPGYTNASDVRSAAKTAIDKLLASTAVNIQGVTVAVAHAAGKYNVTLTKANAIDKSIGDLALKVAEGNTTELLTFAYSAITTLKTLTFKVPYVTPKAETDPARATAGAAAVKAILDKAAKDGMIDLSKVEVIVAYSAAKQTFELTLAIGTTKEPHTPIAIKLENEPNDQQDLANAVKAIQEASLKLAFPTHPGYDTAKKMTDAAKVAIDKLLASTAVSIEDVTVLAITTSEVNKYNIELTKNGKVNKSALGIIIPVAEGTTTELLDFAEDAIGTHLIVAFGTPQTITDPARAAAGTKAAQDKLNASAVAGKVDLSNVEVSVAYSLVSGKLELTLSVKGAPTGTAKSNVITLENDKDHPSQKLVEAAYAALFSGGLEIAFNAAAEVTTAMDTATRNAAYDQRVALANKKANDLLKANASYTEVKAVIERTSATPTYKLTLTAGPGKATQGLYANTSFNVTMGADPDIALLNYAKDKIAKQIAIPYLKDGYADRDARAAAAQVVARAILNETADEENATDLSGVRAFVTNETSETSVDAHYQLVLKKGVAKDVVVTDISVVIANNPDIAIVAAVVAEIGTGVVIPFTYKSATEEAIADAAATLLQELINQDESYADVIIAILWNSDTYNYELVVEKGEVKNSLIKNFQITFGPDATGLEATITAAEALIPAEGSILPNETQDSDVSEGTEYWLQTDVDTLKSAIEEAKDAAEAANTLPIVATKDTLSAAQAKLQAAMTAFVDAMKTGTKALADMTAYNEAVAKVEALEETDYTADSWALFVAAITKCNLVLTNEATQEIIDAEIVKINAALALLVAEGELPKSGWVETAEGSGLYRYYVDGVMLTGLQDIAGELYYFDMNSGIAQTGWVALSDGYGFFAPYASTGLKELFGELYYFDEITGVAKTGWVELDGGWAFFNPSITTGLHEVGGETYYFGEDGIVLDGWQIIGGDFYLFTPWMRTGEVTFEIASGYETYRFDENGKIVLGWYSADGTSYVCYMPYMLTGWQALGGATFYFNPADGVAYVNGTFEIDGESYTFNEDGFLVPPVTPAVFDEVIVEEPVEETVVEATEEQPTEESQVVDEASAE